VTLTVDFNEQTLPFRTDCIVAGARCLVSTNSHEVLQAAAGWRSATRPNAVSWFEMEIIVEESLDAKPGHAAHFRGVRHLVFVLLPPRSFITYDLQRRRVHVLLSAAAARDRSFWATLLLPITIGVLGTTVGVVPLHCACLERKGSGLLLAGISGAGKSTLATALAKRGFAFISDDWTYMSKRPHALTAHGLSCPVKLLPDTVRFFPDLRRFSPRATLNGELAYEIDPRESLRFTVKELCRPDHIFFLERTSSPGCQIVASSSVYVREFFEKSGERLPDELREAKAYRANLIERLSTCPAWTVRTGESPQATAGVIDQFLEEAKHATA